MNTSEEIELFADKLKKQFGIDFEYQIRGTRNMIRNKNGKSLLIIKKGDAEDIKKSMTHLVLHKLGLKHDQDGQNIGFYRDIDIDTLSLEIMDFVEGLTDKMPFLGHLLQEE